jgi:hypothetical protein
VTRLSELGDFLLWAVFVNHNRSQFFAYFLTWYNLLINLDNKYIGLHSARFFLKRIWSPCQADNLHTHTHTHFTGTRHLVLLSALNQGCQIFLGA